MHKILIIEDDVHLQGMLKTLLERNGYDVDAVFDGEDGIEQARNGGYDLVVTDMYLPDISGLEVIEGLLSHQKDLAIIGISGGDVRNTHDMTMLNRARKMGVIEVFKKPFEHQALIDTVNGELKDKERGFLRFLDQKS